MRGSCCNSGNYWRPWETAVKDEGGAGMPQTGVTWQLRLLRIKAMKDWIQGIGCNGGRVCSDNVPTCEVYESSDWCRA